MAWKDRGRLGCLNSFSASLWQREQRRSFFYNVRYIDFEDIYTANWICFSGCFALCSLPGAQSTSISVMVAAALQVQEVCVSAL
jgi:hypothetical protein